MKNLAESLAPTVMLVASASAQPPATEARASPDGRAVVTLTIGDELRYALAIDGKPVLAPAPLSLSPADGRVLGHWPRSCGPSGEPSTTRSRRSTASGRLAGAPAVSWQCSSRASASRTLSTC